MRLDAKFYQRKVAAVQEQLEQRSLDGLLTLNYPAIFYLAGFFHYPNERPIGLFIPRRDDPILFIPRLEVDYVSESGWAPNVEVYEEYPGIVDPIDWICQRITHHGYANGWLGWEESLSFGAHKRLIASLPHVAWVRAGDIIAKQRLIKEPAEIELMRKAAGYADLMLGIGVDLVKSGSRPTEIELEQAMVHGVIQQMQRDLDPIIAVPGLAGALVCSGPRSAFPHGLPTARRIAPGENLILSVACFVGGYFAESERTFLLGDPSNEQLFRYETDRQAQATGTEALRAGTACSAANRRCLDVIRSAGLGEFIRHRQGHGIGIQNHEPPWLEDGDDTILQPGMAVSCEPGIYCPGQGGYRISDSVIVTETGPESLTHFPRALEGIVIERL